MHRFLDRADAVLRHAAIIARDQHRPFRERHEHRFVHLELHRQLEALVARGLNVTLQLA